MEVSYKRRGPSFVSPTLVPQMLHLCSASRQAALQKYQPLKFGAYFTGIYGLYSRLLLFLQIISRFVKLLLIRPLFRSDVSYLVPSLPVSFKLFEHCRFPPLTSPVQYLPGTLTVVLPSRSNADYEIMDG